MNDIYGLKTSSTTVTVLLILGL